MNKSFFLFGPRGTGKTTWLRANLKSSLYLDLLEASIYNELLSLPDRLEKFIPPRFEDWIIIDEIQKIPALLDEVHRLIEKFHYKFILTGSSARSLRKKGINLLAGRALTYNMYPLTTVELGNDFLMDNSLKYGHLPAITSEPDPYEFLKAYIQTYLREEVLQEGLTRNLGGFSRFLETASFSQASVLNISDVARDAALERKKVENYFSILEDLLLAYRLPVFSKRARRRMISHPKFFFFDTGVYRSIRPSGPLDSPEGIDGICLETLCFQELKAINEYCNYHYELYYWRTTNGMEVDFVLYGPEGLLAIEVKRSSRIAKESLSGLRSFKADFPQSRLYLFYGGSKFIYENGIQIVPIDTALKQLSKILENKSPLQTG